MIIAIKKAKLTIVAEGCLECGTHYSFAWFKVKSVDIQVDTRTFSLDICRCGNCQKKFNVTTP